MKRIVRREVAEHDVDEVADYYSDEADQDIAHAFVEAVREAYRAIGDHPGMGSPRYADLLGVEGLQPQAPPLPLSRLLRGA